MSEEEDGVPRRVEALMGLNETHLRPVNEAMMSMYCYYC